MEVQLTFQHWGVEFQFVAWRSAINLNYKEEKMKMMAQGWAKQSVCCNPTGNNPKEAFKLLVFMLGMILPAEFSRFKNFLP